MHEVLNGSVLNKSLRELLTDVPNSDLHSGLVERCEQAMQLQLRELSNAQLRVLVSQAIGLEYVVPLALSRLEVEPLCEGDLYPGDLVLAVLRLPSEFWQDNPDLNNRMVEIKLSLEGLFETLSEEIMPRIKVFEFVKE